MHFFFHKPLLKQISPLNRIQKERHHNTPFLNYLCHFKGESSHLSSSIWSSSDLSICFYFTDARFKSYPVYFALSIFFLKAIVLAAKSHPSSSFWSSILASPSSSISQMQHSEGLPVFCLFVWFSFPVVCPVKSHPSCSISLFLFPLKAFLFYRWLSCLYHLPNHSLSPCCKKCVWKLS